MSVEAAKAESVRRNALYRAHIETCPRCYAHMPCVNRDAYDRTASAADWRLMQARQHAPQHAAREGSR